MPTLWEAIKANTKSLGGSGVLADAQKSGASKQQQEAAVNKNREQDYSKPSIGKNIQPASYKGK